MIGRTVAQYRILERLGGGGMGVVYKAADTTLDRTVALKFLPNDLTRDDIARKRFLVEARAAAKLDHPNICTVFEVGETDDGETFIAMAYYEGESLAARLERGPVPPEEAIRIATDVARGLGAAHEAGIIHRDIKPANIMLTSKGEVKVVDFGIAKLGGATVTRTSSSPGTLAYMAPEQLQGEPATPVTDLWSLGVVLQEMLTGERPFRGDFAQAVAYAILHEEPRAIGEVTRPPTIDAVLAKALMKDPKERYQAAEAMIEALKTATTQGPASTPAPSAASNKSKVTLLSALVLIMVVAIAYQVRKGTPSSIVEPAGSQATAQPPIEPFGKTNPKQVVVAQFENRTGDPALDSLGRNAADWITDELSRIDIPVMSRQYLRDVTKSLQERGVPDADLGTALAKETSSGLLVTGEYYVSGSTLTIRMTLVDVPSSSVLGVIEPVEGDRSDSTKVVQLAGNRVRDALAPRLLGPDYLSSQATMGVRPPRYEAWAEVLLAEERMTERGTAAIDHIKRAIELDPDYAPFYVNLGGAYMIQGRNKEAKEALAEAEKRRAGLTRYGRLILEAARAFMDHRYEQSLAIELELVRLNPGDPYNRHEAMNCMIALGRAREAVAWIDDYRQGWGTKPIPDKWHVDRTMNSALFIVGDYERLLAEARKCKEDPGSVYYCKLAEARALAALDRIDELESLLNESYAQQSGATVAIGLATEAADVLGRRGRKAEATRIRQRAIAFFRELSPEVQTNSQTRLARLLMPVGGLDEAETIYEALAKKNAGKPAESWYVGLLGEIVARRGDRERALQISHDLERFRDSEDLGGVSYRRAKIAAALGEREGTVALLHQAFAEGWSMWPYFYQLTLAESGETFESLYGYPPFEEMLKSK